MKTVEYAIDARHATGLNSGEWFWELQALPGVKGAHYDATLALFGRDRYVNLYVKVSSQRAHDRVRKFIDPYLYKGNYDVVAY